MLGQSTTEILRVYDPAECDEHGVPLDWNTCRGCHGLGGFDASGRPSTAYSDPVCPVCDGHGSLKAAALTYVSQDALSSTLVKPRGEDCGHPVDIRTLGWPHDLRPEKLAVLCLRCWAAR